MFIFLGFGLLLPILFYAWYIVFVFNQVKKRGSQWSTLKRDLVRIALVSLPFSDAVIGLPFLVAGCGTQALFGGLTSNELRNGVAIETTIPVCRGECARALVHGKTPFVELQRPDGSNAQIFRVSCGVRNWPPASNREPVVDLCDTSNVLKAPVIVTSEKSANFLHLGMRYRNAVDTKSIDVVATYREFYFYNFSLSSIFTLDYSMGGFFFRPVSCRSLGLSAGELA